jgi:energy-converting hydrogenase Eha subunit C
LNTHSLSIWEEAAKSKARIYPFWLLLLFDLNVNAMMNITIGRQENFYSMQEQILQKKPFKAPDLDNPSSAGEYWPGGLILCTLLFIACILLTVTPLTRMPDILIKLSIAPGSFLATISAWLPLYIGQISQAASDAIEFFCLIVLAFLLYGLGMLLIKRQKEGGNFVLARRCIWLGALLAGAIYLVTPGLFSHDMLAYASYSRLLATYHANPYFVTISAFPHDPIMPFDQWPQTISVYGPVWMVVCGLLGIVLRPDPLSYIIAFRLVALTMHLLNIWLIGRTLQTMGRSPRTISLGMLIYAWNPLVLLESGLNGHNDICMVTFILLGIFLIARAEKKGLTLQPRGFVPVILALTLAVFVKFTALIILAAYLLFLVCKVLSVDSDIHQPWQAKIEHNWKEAATLLLWSGLAALLATLVLYGPFWLGHNLHEIINSFGNTPAAMAAENSFMRLIDDWLKLHPALKEHSLPAFLGKRQVWNDLNFLALALCFVGGAIWLWHRPERQTLLLFSLATLGLVLLITPWFYPWYITWLIGLAPFCLAAREKRVALALLAFSLTFSLSALSLNMLYNILGSHGYLASLFDTVPPVCAFLLCWFILSPPAASGRQAPIEQPAQ